MARVLLPRLLIDAGLADIATLGLATSIAAEADVALVHALCRWRLVSSPALCATLASALRLPITAVDPVADHELAAACTSSTLSRKLCARLRVLPLWSSGGVLGLGMADPGDDGAVEQVVRASGLSVERLLVDDDALDRGLRRAFVDEAAKPAKTPAAAPKPSFQAAPPTTMTPPTLPTPDPFGEAIGAPPAVLTTVEPLPAFSPSFERSLDVVHGEPSGFEPFDESAELVDPLDDVTRPVEHLTALQRPPTAPVRAEKVDAGVDLSVDDFAPIVSVLVSQSQTATPTRVIDVPPPPPPGIPRRETPGPQTLPMRAPPGAHRHIADMTREVAAEVSSLDDDDTHDARPLPQIRAVASDDRTIPDDSLLFLMRVLIVADGDVAMALSNRLRPRIKQLGVVPMHVAVTTMEQKRWDEVVVVDPPNTVVGSQVLATIAARAKNGAVLFTGIGDFTRLPGVRAAHPLPPTTSAVCDRVVELLLKRAHGE